MSEVPQLSVGQSVEVKVSGTAPVLSTTGDESKPVEYKLEIQARAKEGLLLPSRPVKYAVRTFSFWKDRTWECSMRALSPMTARIDIGLYTGTARASGLRGQIVSETAIPPDPTSIVVASGGKALHKPVVARDGANFVTKYEFQTEPVLPFQRYPIVLFVTYQHPMSKQDWLAAASAIKAYFE